MSVLLREHQISAVNTLLDSALFQQHKGFLLADDTGLGKTFTAVFAMGRLRQFYEFAAPETKPRILVVCPLSVVTHWEDSWLAAGYSLDYARVINYHKLKQLFHAVSVPSPDGKPKRAYQLREDVRPDILIYDEAHWMRHYANLWQKLGLKLMASARYTLFLTATPAQSPLEVGYLQPVLGFTDYFSWMHRSGFQIGKHPTFRNFIWTPNPRDTQVIASAIYGVGKGLRRRASDLAGWPERQIETFPIRLSSSEMHSYQHSLADYLLRREALVGRPHRLSTEQLRLVEVGKLRENLSLLKVPYTVQAALDLLEAGHQVAIFCLYRETAKRINEGLHKSVPTGMLTGSESDPRIRDNIVQQFRQGHTKTIIFTVFEGINLEQPTHQHPTRVQLNHDTPWSGIQAHQVNGRCHRNKMRALVYNLFAHDTIDERVAKRVTERCRAIAQLAGDEADRQLLALTDEDMEGALFACQTPPSNDTQS